MSKTAIIWFREDIRIQDNPALAHAINNYDSVIPVFIMDESARKLGGASKWFLHHCLQELAKNLKEKYSIELIFKKGNAENIIPELIEGTKAEAIFWNRIYEPKLVARDKNIKEKLTQTGVEAKSFNGSLLVEPWQLKTGSGEYYKVFTPFYKKSLAEITPRDIEITPDKSEKSFKGKIDNLGLDQLELLPTKPNWGLKMLDYWGFDEEYPHKLLEEFLKDKVINYANDRDRPDREGTSMLSPYLHFGVISPHQIFHRCQKVKNQHNEKGISKFLSEVYWREFSYNLMFNFGKMGEQNFRPEFDNFPWGDNFELVELWKKGKTGYPIIDAGMRELWETGYMHNRVRMLVGSFLTKHLLSHWKLGEEWFWDCLVDASHANNTASWQWVAGCGADAAPYFRIFNPISQGKKFDPNGDYVKRWVPELSDLPKEFIHTPWEASEEILEASEVELGITYPKPIVDHFKARDAALRAYERIKKVKS